MIPSNYHTHTHFCDGYNSPEELVLEAIRLGCPALGFSGHCYTFFDESYCMTKEKTQAYIADIRALQEKYRGEIRILLGIEQDYHSTEPTDAYDYVIGSVHYVKKDGCYLPVDETKEIQQEGVERLYHGDFYAFIEDYFATVAEVYRKTKCQIVGHFDLIKMFNGGGDLFDPQHPRYQAAAYKALAALREAPVTLEVNTRGIVNGYTEEPYPSGDILRQWKAWGKPTIFSSDCHKAEQLLFGYDIYASCI